MNLLMKSMPDRAFDVGIAEGHAATFSGGMAKEGMQPFCNIYCLSCSGHTTMGYNDIALLRLPVVLCLDRAGLVGEGWARRIMAYTTCLLPPHPEPDHILAHGRT